MLGSSVVKAAGILLFFFYPQGEVAAKRTSLCWAQRMGTRVATAVPECQA